MRVLALALLTTQLGGGVEYKKPLPAATGRFEVRVTGQGGDALMTVRADEALIEDVLRSAALELGKELDGLQRIGRTEPVHAYLVERPVEDALNWIAGSVGLRLVIRPDRIQVLQELPPFPTQAEVFDAAERAYLRALRSYPEHGEAPAALMAKARVQESRGNLQAAVDEYDALINEHHDSPLLPEAMFRSAENLEELGNWRAAASRLDELASLPYAHPYHVEARILLASALCEIGDSQKAIFTLNALEVYLRDKAESGDALDTPSSKIQRLIARARANSELGQPIEAMRTLDLADSYDIEGAFTHETLSVRALAFERSGSAGAAAVAWLKVAEEGEESVRSAALENAARLTLEANDPLGVMFIHRYAENAGLAEVTAPYASQARAGIGLGSQPAALNDQQLLIEAEELALRGAHDLAADRFAGLYERRSGLSTADLLRLGRGYSNSLATSGMLDTAIAAVRGIVPLLPNAPEERQALYLHAAELYEAAGRIDDALEAMRGRL